ncbi:MAG: hypothetical protein Tsb004_12750 [Allomuricauda sp.]
MATVTINNAGLNYSVVWEDTPQDYDMAIVTIDTNARIGAFGETALNLFGYDYLGLTANQLSKGYQLLRVLGKRPILFVVMEDNEISTNLEKALLDLGSSFESKNIWLPLLGTELGSMDYHTSFQGLIGVIGQFESLFFTITIPRNEQGQTLLSKNNINIYNPLFDIVEEKNLYVAGHIWGHDNDQLDRFIAEGLWENGHDDQDTKIVNSVRVGDLVLLKSTFQQDGVSYLRIKGIGVVLVNHQDGHRLEMNWHIFDTYIDIDNLGKYRRTFTQLNADDRQLVLENLWNKHLEILLILEVLLAIPKEVQYERNEAVMDANGTLYFGQRVGEEIRDYDIIFLPKSSHGGVGNNSIATHILQLLGIDKNSISFSNESLTVQRYASHIISANGKTYLLCFIITRDEEKEAISFESQFFKAVENFRKSAFFNELVSSNRAVKIFFPFLGTGQAGMSMYTSYRNLLAGSKRLMEIPLKKVIRVNYPRELEFLDIIRYNARFLIAFRLRPSVNAPDMTETVDKIPFHLDRVVEKDKLGRDPVAKAFVNLIKKDIFTDELNDSFMVHLQGEWGAGKSSFLKLIAKHLCANGENWIVVEYNAWQNQHIDPPWWTLIDQIYRKSKSQLSCTDGIKLWAQENKRRIWHYTGWDKITGLLVFFLFVVIFIFFREGIFQLFQTKEGEHGLVLKNLSDGVDLVLAICSLIGILYTFSRFITIPFFINSSKEAKSFVLRASDPMNKVKRHFNSLVDNINSKKNKRQLAVFIDDIDRCDKEFIVKLLEGIQTLFKEKRVLYMVAGDKNWIVKSFGKVYADFLSPVQNEERLGEFFLEKAFQLSFRMPNISEESKKRYWKGILGVSGDSDNQPIEDIAELSNHQQEEIKTKLTNAKTRMTDPDFMREMEQEYNLSEGSVSNMVIQEKNKDSSDIRHLLNDFYDVMDANPRSIIRLANYYTMVRSTLIAERKKIDEQKIFRWLVIEDLCPNVKRVVARAYDIKEIETVLEGIPDPVNRDNCFDLLRGTSGRYGGTITLDEIKTIMGL